MFCVPNAYAPSFVVLLAWVTVRLRLEQRRTAPSRPPLVDRPRGTERRDVSRDGAWPCVPPV